MPRHFPDLSEQARPITESQARLKLTELYFRSVGAASTSELGKLFGWRKVKLTKAVQLAEQAGLVHSGLTDTTSGEDLIALTELR
ncbi:MAG: hypothetical protein IIA51_08695 [Chloroflexi bacterium]|nr:hypothetical protein [Chloroflexota bacterium]